eukprot:403376613
MDSGLHIKNSLQSFGKATSEYFSYYMSSDKDEYERQREYSSNLLDPEANNRGVLTRDQNDGFQGYEQYQSMNNDQGQDRSRLYEITSTVTDTFNTYVVGGAKTIIVTLYDGIQWGVSKILLKRQTSQFQETFFDRHSNDQYQTV